MSEGIGSEVVQCSGIDTREGTQITPKASSFNPPEVRSQGITQSQEPPADPLTSGRCPRASPWRAKVWVASAEGAGRRVHQSRGRSQSAGRFKERVKATPEKGSLHRRSGEKDRSTKTMLHDPVLPNLRSSKAGVAPLEPTTFACLTKKSVSSGWMRRSIAAVSNYFPGWLSGFSKGRTEPLPKTKMDKNCTGCSCLLCHPSRTGTTEKKVPFLGGDTFHNPCQWAREVIQAREAAQQKLLTCF